MKESGFYDDEGRSTVGVRGKLVHLLYSQSVMVGKGRIKEGFVFGGKVNLL
jgi:hypothetical protein